MVKYVVVCALCLLAALPAAAQPAQEPEGLFADLWNILTALLAESIQDERGESSAAFGGPGDELLPSLVPNG